MPKLKRIWVIGGGTGIGREIALKLAHGGNKVVISGRSVESLTEVAAAYANSAGSTAEFAAIIPLVYDVTDDQSCDAIGQEVLTLLGGIDILVFCAGRCEYVDDAQLSADLFRRVYDVNVFGLVNALAATLPLMRKDTNNSGAHDGAGNPQVVGVASLSAVVGLPRAEAYGSSKAAMIYLLDSLRLDLDRYNIDVTVANPGFVETPMTASNDFPMPFIMQAGDAADCIVRGIEKRKRTVDFPWALLATLKIASFFPALWYGLIGPKLARTPKS